jgi:putative transposase
VKAVTDTLEISRSHQYEKKKEAMRIRRHYQMPGDEKYLSFIRTICYERATYGYRRITAILNRQLREKGEPVVNHKRVYRLMNIHNLLLQKHTGRPVRLHEGKIITLRSNMRWCSDVFEIACWNRERIRVAFCMDCADREVLSFIATTGGISGNLIRDLMAEAIEYRFGIVDEVPEPIQWLSDNAPGYIAYETRSFAHMMGLEVCTTPYHSPESNGMAESFIKTFKRDHVYMNELPDAVTVLEKLPEWFEDYNENHPHKGLKMKSPREYIKLMNRVYECPVL